MHYLVFAPLIGSPRGAACENQLRIKLNYLRLALHAICVTPLPRQPPPSPATSTEGRRSQLLCQLDAAAAVALLRVDAVAAACNASNAMQNGKHTHTDTHTAHTHRHTTYTQHTGLSYFKAFSCCFEKGNSSRLVSSLVSCAALEQRAVPAADRAMLSDAR